MNAVSRLAEWVCRGTIGSISGVATQHKARSRTRLSSSSSRAEIVESLNRELSQFERIKKFRVLPREFTIESGELTPTMKVKRKAVEQAWRGEIEELYAETS